eukprot:CAMPEP_0172531286 /NCGR_PEP_ID=MMETSP1067-20121228/4761_1 /TAXON_ID=265564 ORGANISM="Thalassiosira punctigera, Strain Tpunct2005C2" /NCGR_SAMPLE_ID=MMETSP1067 /ASSEMBLY_ACC=CAM_ASM_000444 /LENGTH=137 /DNA_ID=CAMNT_0013315651 /DNA_START=143 /DNA_END=556 /DNA_ORIENTATION=+
MMTSQQQQQQSQPILVPTMNAPRKKEMIDPAQLSEQDLKELRGRDPFMYYSIFAMHTESARREHRRRANDGPSSSFVSRKSRLSTECHTDVIMEDLLLGGGGDDFSNAPVDGGEMPSVLVELLGASFEDLDAPPAAQ